jgi:acylphosphatase
MTVHIKIGGKVQGVFFRASTKEKADELKIRGWVKNISDGNVEIVATGSDESIRDFINWCHKGPRGALVSDIKITEEAEEIKFERFLIAR